MDNYKLLALKYLKKNKKRTVSTIVGVMMTVMVLFAGLNFIYGLFLNEKESARKESNYDMILYAKDGSSIADVANDDVIMDAYEGAYYDDISKKNYAKALYVTVDNPYHMNDDLEYLKTQYDIDGELNYYLSSFYFQDEDTSIYIFMLITLLIGFVFAVFGVGIIRNSIQLFSLEQIQDYGILRCVGATKGQLRSYIYVMGLVMESIGIVLGILVGYGLSFWVGHLVGIKARITFLPILFVLFVYLGDLYFVMRENVKFINNMTPIMAVRGELRIKKEKLKRRRKTILSRVFGIEWDYAHKNLKRNPGRFYKTVLSIGLCIGLAVAVLFANQALSRYAKDMFSGYGYYQLYYGGVLGPDVTMEEIQSVNPNAKDLKKLEENSNVTDSMPIYNAYVDASDAVGILEQLSDDYINKTYEGSYFGELKEELLHPEQSSNQEEMESDGDGLSAEELAQENEKTEEQNSRILLSGYDGEDYARLKENLIDGTLEVSKNGVILVSERRLPLKPENEEDEEAMLRTEYGNVKMFDYKVGDTIEIVDPIAFKELCSKKVKEKTKELADKKASGTTEETTEEIAGYDEDGNPYYESDFEQETVSGLHSDDYTLIRAECKKQLVAEGKCKTYTIEGIVSTDPNLVMSEATNYNGPFSLGTCLIVPLQNYFEIMSSNENDVCGIAYHMKNKNSLNNKLTDTLNQVEDNMMETLWHFENTNTYSSSYSSYMYTVKSMKKTITYMLLIIVFVLSLSAVNIVNTTSSNLYLRKKEFAQLRVIGMSKKRLTITVLYEGIITTLVSNIIGLIVGSGSAYFLYRYIRQMVPVRLTFPIVSYIIIFIISAALFCLSIYVPIQNMGNSMAEDLTKSGD